MSVNHEMRAVYDRDSIMLDQVDNQHIAQLAIQHQKFVTPFSLQSMIWIKPSFLWLMRFRNIPLAFKMPQF